MRLWMVDVNAKNDPWVQSHDKKPWKVDANAKATDLEESRYARDLFCTGWKTSFRMHITSSRGSGLLVKESGGKYKSIVLFKAALIEILISISVFNSGKRTLKQWGCGDWTDTDDIYINALAAATWWIKKFRRLLLYSQLNYASPLSHVHETKFLKSD